MLPSCLVQTQPQTSWCQKQEQINSIKIRRLLQLRDLPRKFKYNRYQNCLRSTRYIHTYTYFTNPNIPQWLTSFTETFAKSSHFLEVFVYPEQHSNSCMLMKVLIYSESITYFNHEMKSINPTDILTLTNPGHKNAFAGLSSQIANKKCAYLTLRLFIKQQSLDFVFYNKYKLSTLIKMFISCLILQKNLHFVL